MSGVKASMTLDVVQLEKQNRTQSCRPFCPWVCTLGHDTKICLLLNHACDMSYLTVFICNKGFYWMDFMKKFVLTFSSHMRYKGFVQLIPLSFLSCVFSPSWSLFFSPLKKSDMLACRACFVIYPRVKPSCEKSESLADVIPMLL